MKAAQVSRPGGDFQIVDRPVPQPGLNEVLVQVEACGVCHGDALVKEGGFPGLTYPRVPGHEIVGRVTELGPGVHEWSVGARVGVGWHGGHCWRCSACRRGDFGACESALTTGLSTDGGYGEFTVVRSEVAVALPEDLPATVLAPLLCAGNVTFSALRDAGVGGGDLVAIHGLGGLGHLAVQYATRLGCRTVVLSRGKSKEPLAYQLGAHSYIDTERDRPRACPESDGWRPADIEHGTECESGLEAGRRARTQWKAHPPRLHSRASGTAGETSFWSGGALSPAGWAVTCSGPWPSASSPECGRSSKSSRWNAPARPTRK